MRGYLVEVLVLDGFAVEAFVPRHDSLLVQLTGYIRVL